MSIERIFPTENDVGGNTKGRVYSEANMRDLLKVMCNHSFIIEGFGVTNPSGLTLRVAPGKAAVAGMLVQENANQDISASASQAGYHLWLVLRDTDSDGLVDDFNYQGTTNDTPPSGGTIVGTLLLAVAETSGSAVTKLHVWGASGAGMITGWYVGSNADNRLIALPINPRFVVVARDKIYAQSGPAVVFANAFTYLTDGSGQVGHVAYQVGANWFQKTSTSRADRPHCVAGGFYVSHTTASGDDSLNESALVYNFAAWA